MVISKLFVRYGRRQLHTIVSRDIVKPSSPTPSHRKTYNLSLLDQLSINAYIPMVTFFPISPIHRSSDYITTDLKNSLSKTLTQYYPFAGRMPRFGQTFIDCNDNGVDFIEATNDLTLSDFLQYSDHKDLDQLIPDNLIWFRPNHTVYNNDISTSRILAIQINHFACGGVAIATSLSHKIGDATSLFNFVNHWATVTRLQYKDASYINPHFITYKTRNIKVPEILPERQEGDDCVTRSFVFPNSKKNDLIKAMVTATSTEFGQPIITNPAHDEGLTWLIHNRAMAAATKTNSGTFKPTGLGQIINMRNNFIEPLPETSVGNIYQILEIPTSNESEVTPDALVGELRERTMDVRRIRNVESMMGMIEEMYSENGMVERLKKLDVYYLYSFLNKFPTYGIDFGWGSTPVKVTIAGTQKNVTIFMASPDGEGIEAIVSLKRRDMEIFQNDPQLLAFCCFRGFCYKII